MAAGNWESAVFQGWLYQMILSELLGVPVTLESGKANAKINVYDPSNPLQYGVAYSWEAIQTAYQRKGDCTGLSKTHPIPPRDETPTPSDDDDEEEYQACAHVMLELWHGRFEAVNRSFVRGEIEQPVPR